MGVRVAYGKKSKITSAIASGVIPKDSLIITSDAEESELFFYDAAGNMKRISERKQFATISEAQAWVDAYGCDGNIISVHNGSDWVPYIVSDEGALTPVGSGEISMDGNYSAENVYFADDLTYTAAIGVLTVPSSGSGTIAASGKNVKDVLASILAKEKNPTATQPAVTITCKQIAAYEVGSKVTPAYTASLSAGSYTYGPATGITATAWSVTDGAATKDTASGSFDELTVGDATSYAITATATHGEGAVPVTNLGNAYAAGKIAAGNKSKATGKITGYRNSFYGTLEAKDGEVNSALVRGLSGKSGKALAAGNSFNLAIPVGAIRVVFAYPATLRDVSSVQDVNGMNAEVKTAFTKSVVSVEGANGYQAIDYKVYVMDMANANDTANTYKVTI